VVGPKESPKGRDEEKGDGQAWCVREVERGSKECGVGKDGGCGRVRVSEWGPLDNCGFDKGEPSGEGEDSHTELGGEGEGRPVVRVAVWLGEGREGVDNEGARGKGGACWCGN